MLTPDQKRFVDNIWKRLTSGVHKPKITYFQLYTLYDWFLKSCRKYDIEPDLIDFEAIIDPELSYVEIKHEIEDKVFSHTMSKPEEVLEEYYSPEYLSHLSVEQTREAIKELVKREARELNNLFRETVKEDEKELGPPRPVSTISPPKPLPSPMPPKGKYPICPICGKPILPGQKWTIIDGEKVHWECYKKMSSKSSLAMDARNILEEKVDGHSVAYWILMEGVRSPHIQSVISGRISRPSLAAILHEAYWAGENLELPPEYVEWRPYIDRNIIDILDFGVRHPLWGEGGWKWDELDKNLQQLILRAILKKILMGLEKLIKLRS